MPDISREAMESRVLNLRQAAAALREHVGAVGIKELIRRRILFALDDVEEMFLGDPASRPYVSAHESWWLEIAETILRNSEGEFRQLAQLVEKYGGPDKIGTIE